MVNLRKLAIAAFAVGGAALLGGCSDYGYGYTGVNVGYGAPGYYDGYGYDNYAYGYGSPYGYGGLGGGWYDNFYYPGTGYYVYDRGGRRQRWNDGQRRYWEGRREARNIDPARRDFRRDRRDDRQDFRRERRDDRQALRRGDVTRDAFRADRQGDRQAFRAQRQQAREAYRAQRGTTGTPTFGQRQLRREGFGGGQRGFRGGARNPRQ